MGSEEVAEMEARESSAEATPVPSGSDVDSESDSSGVDRGWPLVT